MVDVVIVVVVVGGGGERKIQFFVVGSTVELVLGSVVWVMEIMKLTMVEVLGYVEVFGAEDVAGRGWCVELHGRGGCECGGRGCDW